MNYYNYSYGQPLNNNYEMENRQLFFPFLTGALVGGAAVGLTRPRPIYNVSPYQNMPPYYYQGAPYSYYSYQGYVPRQY